jgi:hypothetical protein
MSCLGSRLRGIAILATLVLTAVVPPPAYGAAPPPNDDFADAAPVGGSSGSVTGTLTGATLESGEPRPSSGSATIWWAWTAPANGVWRFELDSANAPVSVWRGPAVDQLTAVTAQWCRAGLAGGPYIQATAGQVYYLQVSGWDGPVTLSWSPGTRPANDAFAAAVAIDGYNGGRDTTTCLATKETGEPQASLASGQTVWFRWRAPDRVRVEFSTADDNAVVYIWRGTSVGALTAAGRRLNTQAVELVPDKDAVYYLQVATSASQTFYAGVPTTLSWKHYVAANDFNYNAPGIPPAEVPDWYRSGVFWTDNVDATRQAGEPALITGQTGATLWWSVLPLAVPATLTLDTSQSTPDTVIGVFAGAPTGTLTRLAVADGNGSTAGAARLSVSLTTGRTYTVIVDSKSGRTGAIRLAWWIVHPRPGNDDFGAAYSIGGTSGASRSWTWQATRQSGEPYHAGVATTRTVWWRWTAPRAGRIVFTGPAYGPFVAYRGSTLGGLTTVARGTKPADPFAPQRIQFIAAAGTTYRIVVGTDQEVGSSGNPGPVTLGWTLYPVPPPNDNLASARVITGPSGGVVGTTYGATPELADSVIGYGTYPSTVWYRWTAPASGWWRFSAWYSDAAAYLGVRVPGTEDLYRVDRRHHEPDLWSLPYPGRQGMVYLRAVYGTTYNIVVGTPGPPLESEVRLYWAPGPPYGTPANDDVAKAAAITGSQGAVAGRLANSTSEPGERHGYETGGVWYRWTAPGTGRITWHTAPTESSQHLTFYRGSGLLGALVKLAENGNYPSARQAARVDVDVTAGTTYSIRVSALGTGDAFTLTWGRPTPPPVNDDLAAATTLSPASSGRIAGTMLWGSRQSGEPAPPYTEPASTVWYRWQPAVSGLATVGIESYFARVSVWTGSGIADLVPVPDTPYEPRYHRSTFDAVAGQTYWVQVAEDGYAGPFTLDWSTERPPYDDFAAARVISGDRSAVSGFSAVRATAEPGEPEVWSGHPAEHSIWFRWTAPHSGPVEFQEFGGLSSLSVFQGDSVGSLSRIGAAEHTQAMTFTALAGQTYRIRVDGLDDRIGLSWQQHWDTTPPTVGIRADRTLATTRWVGITLGGADTGSGLLGWYVSNQAPVGGQLTGASAWVPAGSSPITWSLTHTAYGGRPVDGTKRVYVQSIDRQNNRSAPTWVTVTLDR